MSTNQINQYIKEIKSFAQQNAIEDVLRIYPNTADVSPFYLDADILIHPALSETFPYVILEGMYFGLPVVASAIGGIPEQITMGQQGYLHAPNDTSAFADSILKLYDNKSHYKAVSASAQKKVKDRFGIERMTSAYRILLSELYTFRKIQKHHITFPSPQEHVNLTEVGKDEVPFAYQFKKKISAIAFQIGEKLSKRKIRSKYYELLMQQGISHSRALGLQKQLLFATLKHCEIEVPYYRDLFKKHQFNADLILQDIKYLEKLPLLSKDDIHEHFKEIQVSSSELVHWRYSNGSTGVSRAVLYSTDDLDWSAAVSLYSRFLWGKDPSDPEVHFATPSPVPQTFETRWKEVARNLALNRKVVLTSDLSEDSLEKSFQQLKNINTVLVQGQPSVFYALACYLLGKYTEREWPTIKIFEATGEVLDPLKAQTIARVFRCKVVNRYGLAEFGVVGLGIKDPFQVEVLPTIVYPESVDGEIVLTSLRRKLMPLIRYKTGDLGTIVEESDRTMIHGLYGRVFESIQLKGKLYSTKQLQDMILSFPDVIEFQVVQSPAEVELRLALRSGARVEWTIEQMRSMFHESMNVKIKGLNEFIRRGNSSKFRHVVNLRD